MDIALYQLFRDVAAHAFADSAVLFAYLFGSVARRLNRLGRAVDVAAYLEASADPERFMHVSLCLTESV